MIKEILTLQALSRKLKELGIKSVAEFLVRCEDSVGLEELRQQLALNVTLEQWSGAIAVVRELFK